MTVLPRAGIRTPIAVHPVAFGRPSCRLDDPREDPIHCSRRPGGRGRVSRSGWICDNLRPVAWGPARLRDAHKAAQDLLPTDPGALNVRGESSLTAQMDTLIAEQTTTAADIQSLPGVAGAIRLLAGHMSGMTLTSDSPPVPNWMARPRSAGGNLDIGDLIQFLVDSMVIHGKGYVRATCTSEGDAPSFRLDALDPNYVQVRARTDGVIGLEYLVAGEPIPTVPYSLALCVKGRPYIVHVPYRVSVKHPEGTTPLVDAAVTLRGHVQTERHASFLFDAGTYTGGVLTTEQDITPDQATEAAAEWTAGGERGKVRVLGNGIKYYNEVPNAVDLQMVETRSFAMAVTASLLGIPVSIMGLSLMGGQSSLSYSNAQDQEKLYSKNALRPIGEQLTSSFSNLLPHGRNADEAQRIEFDYSAWEGDATDVEEAPEPEADPDADPAVV